MSKTNTASAEVLNYHLKGAVPIANAPTLVLLTDVEALTEVPTAGGYQPYTIKATDFASVPGANNLNGAQATNAAEIKFGPSSGAWAGGAQIIGVGVKRGAQFLRAAYLVSGSYYLFTMPDTPNADTLIVPNHNFSLNDPVLIFGPGPGYGGAIPGPATQGSLYYVYNPTTTTIQLVTAIGNTTPVTLTVGAGRVVKSASFAVTGNNVTPSFPVSGLNFYEA